MFFTGRIRCSWGNGASGPTGRLHNAGIMIEFVNMKTFPKKCCSNRPTINISGFRGHARRERQKWSKWSGGE